MFRYSWQRAAAVTASIGAIFGLETAKRHFEKKSPAAFAAAPAPVDEARLDGLFAVVRAVGPRDRERLLKSTGVGEPLSTSASWALALGPDYLAAVRNHHWRQHQQRQPQLSESSDPNASRQHPPPQSAETQQWMGATAALRMAGWTDAEIAKQRAAGASVLLHVVQRRPYGASDHATWDFVFDKAFRGAFASRSAGGAPTGHGASTPWSADPVHNMAFAEWTQKRENRAAMAASPIGADATYRTNIDEFDALTNPPTDGAVPPLHASAASERVVSSARQIVSHVLGLNEGFAGDGWVHTPDDSSTRKENVTASVAPPLRVRQYLVPSVAASGAHNSLSAVIELQWP
jgi:hypothetical protein